MAIKVLPDASAKVTLHQGMCEDRHVPDFLLCLHCWLWRSFGDPKQTGKPYRLYGLDISRNHLSDESLCSIIELLQRLDVRVLRLWVQGNRLGSHGLQAITQFVWNCAEPLLEIDISENEVPADSSAELGSDSFSALLRCLYNHQGYPTTVDDGRELKDRCSEADGIAVCFAQVKYTRNFIINS